MIDETLTVFVVKMQFTWLLVLIFCDSVGISVCICWSCWGIRLVCCSRSIVLVWICRWYKLINSWCWCFKIWTSWFFSISCWCSWRVCRRACSNIRYSLVGFCENLWDAEWWHWQVQEEEEDDGGGGRLEVNARKIFLLVMEYSREREKESVYLLFQQYHHQQGMDFPSRTDLPFVHHWLSTKLRKDVFFFEVEMRKRFTFVIALIKTWFINVINQRINEMMNICGERSVW